MKRSISIVLVGHVDCGKSTLGGHFLYKLGMVDQRLMDRYEIESNEIGKGSFKYSWILSKLKAERERGITINVSWKMFDSGKYEVNLYDVPGHRDFMRNALTGISMADVAIMIIDASRGGFETGISQWGQTREHMICTFGMGLKQMIILVNKMDCPSVEYRETRFEEISDELRKMMRNVGYKPKKVPIIPVSGWKGENLVDNSGNYYMPWWKKGKTKFGGMNFLDVLNTMKLSNKLTRLPLRIPVLDCVKIGGIGTVVVGKVDSGVISVGQNIQLSPSPKIVRVISLEKNQKSIESGYPGDLIGIGVQKQGVLRRHIRRGFVVGSPDNNPPRVVERMEVQLVNISLSDIKIRVGYEPILSCYTNHVRCKIEKIISKINKRSGAVVKENPKELKKREMGRVLISYRLTPPMKVKVELIAEPYPSRFGRILLRDQRHVVAVGIIKRVYKRGLGWVSSFSRNSMVDVDEKERREFVMSEYFCEEESNVQCCIGFQTVFEHRKWFIWKSLFV